MPASWNSATWLFWRTWRRGKGRETLNSSPSPEATLSLQAASLLRLVWWWGKDSNLRSRWRQIYSLLPLAAREPHLIVKYLNGAGTKSRTRDLLITSQLLYQLSYAGIKCCAFYGDFTGYATKKLHVLHYRSCFIQKVSFFPFSAVKGVKIYSKTPLLHVCLGTT